MPGGGCGDRKLVRIGCGGNWSDQGANESSCAARIRNGDNEVPNTGERTVAAQNDSLDVVQL
jgi:hypothetical protein